MEPTVVSKFAAIVAIFYFSFFSNLTFAKSTTHSKRVEDYFEIINSIQHDDQKSTIGELDIVVINKFSGMVEAVA